MHGLLLAVAAMTSQAQGPLHYKVESSAVTDIDMSSMGMAAQHIAMKSTALITVTMSDTAGGRLAHVVVDSVVFDGGDMMAQAMASMPAEMTANGKGSFFHMYVPTGKAAASVMPSSQSLSVVILAPAVGALFPGLKPTMKLGDTWTDTVKKDTTVSTGGMGSMNGTTNNISTWKVSSTSGKDFVLDGSSTGTMTAAMPGGMGQMDMKMSGTQHVITSSGGPAKEGNIVTKTSGAMSVAGQTIPMTATSTVTITPLP